MLYEVITILAPENIMHHDYLFTPGGYTASAEVSFSAAHSSNRSPHRHRESMTGITVCPSAVREYSTRGGTCG